MTRSWPLVAVLMAGLSGAAAAAEPPAGLACLARHYALTPVEQDGRWFGRLPDGKMLPWDDGRAKSVEERIERPDLDDMLSLRYATGEIRPAIDPAQDPGRIRVDALFGATYPARELATVSFLGQRVRFHRRASAALVRVAARLQRALHADHSLRAYLQPLGGTVAIRPIAGTDRTSAHAWGIAIDINTRRSDYWRWQRGPIVWKNRIPQPIVAAFEAEGFIWGGRWYHFDTMHFEWRPELLDPTCR